MLAAAICLLLAWTAVGMLVSASLARSPAGPGFYRMVLLVAAGLLTVGLGVRLAGGTPALPSLGVAGGAYAVAVGAAVTFGVRLTPGPISRFGVLHVAAATAAVAVLADPALSPPPTLSGIDAVVWTLGLVTVVPAMGAVLFGMLLAHWYLVEPRMPLEPLQRVLLLFAGVEALKLALLVGVVAHHLPEWAGGDGGLVRAFTLGNAIFVAMRAFLGILAPLGLTWMTWKTVEIRSIQSATGILYAAIVFALFGETISLYLSLATGHPY